jgi:hypothetical protein
MAIPLVPEVYIKGLNVVSSFLFWGYLPFLCSEFTLARAFNQNRLKRLVREHKDYTRESEEIADLLERKRDTRIR